MSKPQRRKRTRTGKVAQLTTDDQERLSSRENERKTMVENGIRGMEKEQLQELLLQLKDREPGLIFDILENAGDPDLDPPANTANSPSWCRCSNCTDMPSYLEEKCCGCLPRNCVSNVPEMDLLVLDRRVLRLAHRYTQDMFGLHKKKIDDYNKMMRHTAYRQFVLWRHGRLPSGVRRVIPSCVVGRIRQTFPSPSNVYTGFMVSRIA